jgi:perosamine synthetase
MTQKNIVLFHPHMPTKASEYVADVMKTRWIGQGPLVDKFENQFSDMFCNKRKCLAVGSGTDALHLSYVLADIQPGDEVITQTFTCTATNIPLLYMGAKIVFADIQKESMNIDPLHVKSLVTSKTKAIVCVPYGGLPCDIDELQAIADDHGLKLIIDGAHAIGAEYKGKQIATLSDFVMFSFQAIKTITTADGGMLVLKDDSLLEKAKRIRWFGIDRKAKQLGIWENDITEIGYKYQMTDISAAMGLAALEEIDSTLALRKNLWDTYVNCLTNVGGVSVIGAGYGDREHAAWICTILAENRVGLQAKLKEKGIESNQVHYRNDRYSIFGGRRNLPNMDEVEDKYLVLPLHTKMNVEDVQYICDVIKTGW